MGTLKVVTDQILGGASTASQVYNDYLTKQAELSTDVKQSRLRGDINAELARIKQDTHYQNWNDEINTFFENIKNGMSNKDSPYYCENNLQAEMFTKILDQNLINVSDHVNNMVISEQQAEARVNINNGILNYKNQGVAGQDLYDLSKKLVDGGWAIKAYTREQYNQMLDQIFYDSYGSMYEQMFDKTWSEAIDRGDSWDTVKNMMMEKAPQMMKTDGDNMPVAFDKEAYDSRIFDNLERKFKAKQQDIWTQTEKRCSQIFDSVMDGSTAEERNQARLVGRQYLDTLKNTGKISPEQLTKWTNYFKLEDPSTTKAGAASAFKKLTPKEKMDFYLREWEKGSKGSEGGINSLYNAREMYKENMLAEVREINPDAKWVDVEKAYPDCMGFFEEAKKRMKNIPGMSDIINTAENMLGTILNTKDDKKKYEEEAGRAMDIVFDMLSEVDISNMDKATVDEYKKRVAIMMNSLYGGVLEKQKDYKWLKDDKSNLDVLRDYKEGVFGNEATMAKALQERAANPDLVYKDRNQTIIETYGDDLKAGLTSLEAAEKSQLQDYLKYNAGLKISDKDIKSDYESDGVYDVNPNKIYTVVARDKNGQMVDEYQYKFSSADGKHVTMERKKKGSTEWEPVRTVKQQEKYDSPRETAKRAVDNIDVSTVPPFELKNNGAVSGRFSQEVWNGMSKTQKRNIIMSLLSQYPEEMQKWLDEQPDKSKK